MSQAVWFAVAVALAVVSLALLGRAQGQMLSAGGTRVPARRMIELTYAANAVNWTLPGGTALSAGYVAKQLKRWGASGAATGFTIAASGLLSAISFAALAVTGSSVGGPGVTGSLVSLSLLVLAAGVVVVARRHPDAAAGTVERVVAGAVRLIRRDPERARAAVHSLVADLAAIHPRRRDWAVGLIFAAGNWLADLACLYACCRAMGIESPDPALLLVTYIVGMTASSISLLPGGIGVVDVAMIATLSGTAGVGGGTAAAVVISYRIVSCALVVAIGWGCWFALRRSTAAAARRVAESAQAAGEAVPAAVPDSDEPGAGLAAEPPPALAAEPPPALAVGV